MRFKLFSVLSILLLVGLNDARPSKHASPEVVEERDDKSLSKRIVDESSSRRPIEPRSSSVVKTDSRSELKDLQYMDQSLRTVATQLLNVTSPNGANDPTESHKMPNSEKLSANVLLIHKPDDKINSNPSNFVINERSDEPINPEISSMGPMGVGFGRPTNSKFGFFESSHPGVAMAMTEEELERELKASSSTRLITAHKNNPTTTGGISTWILLNPPKTTSKPIIEKEIIDNEDIGVLSNSPIKLTTPVEIFPTTTKNDVKPGTKLENIVSTQLTTPMERITTLTKSTTSSLKNTTPRPMIATQKIPKTTQSSSKIEKTKITSIPKTSNVVKSISETTNLEESITTPKTVSTTRKYLNTSRTTTRPKITTPKATNVTSKPMVTKLSRPVDQTSKAKISPTRRTSTKIPVETTKNPHTSKIEKVTFRPVHMITTPKNMETQLNVERPIFVTKIKTSFVTDSNPIGSQMSSMNSTTLNGNGTKSESLDIELAGLTKAKKPTKTNNVLNVQLKKPMESLTNIEPIKVNTPVLRIETIESQEKSSTNKNLTKTPDSMIFDDSRIDVKFDFNPEVTKIVTETSTPADEISTTTKRSHKRKKNKLRRRKPTTTSLMTSETTPISSNTNPTNIPSTTENIDILTELGIDDNTIQESKIAPESKVTSSSGDNGTKNKKKQVQKPIGTQIYNFLSREVMPSFGVMSLVGLGIGLASYLFYPFSGAIARRNYVVEPNYKYNMDEYGGNYGQSEEEVFSKVLQGMTNNDGKYGGIKDYENNFYRYKQTYDGPYTDRTYASKRVSDPLRYSTDSAATIYRPLDTTIYDNQKYRNSEFKYPELSTTSNYYETPRKPEFVGKKSADRQFVVGNIPKEYGYDDRGSNFVSNPPVVTTETQRTNFPQKNDYKFTDGPSNISPSYGHAEALKANEDYDEIEITPSAVAVEHGPRSLTNVLPRLQRKKRNSVIQVIPSRTEIEKEIEEIMKGEPLSNEILDIIDSVIPGEMIDNEKKKNPLINENDRKHSVEKKASGDDLTSKQVGPTVMENVTDQFTTQTPEESTRIIEATDKTNLSTENIESSEKLTTLPSNSLDSGSTTSTTSETRTASSTTVHSLTIDEILGTTSKSADKDPEDSSTEWFDNTTTPKPQEEKFNVFNFVKKIAEVKLRLGVAILKHASEGLARYLGHVQKRINGEE